jgi:hypothetical protein
MKHLTFNKVIFLTIICLFWLKINLFAQQQKIFIGKIVKTFETGWGGFWEANLVNDKGQKISIQYIPSDDKFIEENNKVKIVYTEREELLVVGVKLSKDKQNIKLDKSFDKGAKNITKKNLKYINGEQGDMGKYLTIIENGKEITLQAIFDVDIDNKEKYDNQMIDIICNKEKKLELIKAEKLK